MNHRSFCAARASALMGIGLWLAASGVARAAEPVLSDESSALLAKIAQYYAQLSEVVKSIEAPVISAFSSAPAPATGPLRAVGQGVQGAALQPRGLQPSSGIQGAGRGLTPQEEWRLMFPRKVQP